jgi:hypothetical protein
MAQVEQYLSSKQKALSSSPNTAKKIQKVKFQKLFMEF